MRKTLATRKVASAAALASLVGLVIAVACDISKGRGLTSPNAPAVTAIALSPQQVTLTTGDSVAVIATPEDSSGGVVTGVTVDWASSATTVATVSGTGEVHAVAAGSATITASVAGAAASAQNSLPVTVSLVPVASVALTPSDSLACVAGTTVQFFAKALDANGNLLFNRPVTWVSAQTNVATADSTGLVHCVAPGTATVTATIEGKSASGKVVVSAVAVASVVLAPAGTQSCLPGVSIQVTATPKDASGNSLSGRVVTWSSSVPAVASVGASSGLIQCVSAGRTNVTALVEGKQASDSIIVSLVPVASVTLNPAGQQACPVGGSLTVAATAKDSAGNVLAGRTITWSSSSTAIASVASSGATTANVQCVAASPPTAIVTAKIETKQASDTVTVSLAAVGSVVVTPNPDSVRVGSMSTLTAVVKDKSGKVLTGRPIAWSTISTSVATISGSGATATVTGVATGATKSIAATGGVADTTSIVVTLAPTGLVQVPVSMRTPPFNVPRTLNLPAGYAIAVYTRIPGVRFVTATPDGNLLASNPGAGTVYLVRPNGGQDPLVTTFASGFGLPQDLVFHVVGGVTYLYVAESSQITRFVYHNGDLTGQGRQTIITGLPNGSTTGLNGAYAHALKDVALDGNNNLYVSLGSSCNVCTVDDSANPVRGSIYLYNADGSGGRLFAKGIRNAEGLAILPGTNTLWTAVNMRDNVPYPSHDGKYPYQDSTLAYVDNHPPDEVMPIVQSGNYGWPYCNPTPDSAQGYDNMPFDPAVDPGINDAGQVDCSSTGPMTRITKGIQAHSAPLGLTFLQSTSVQAALRSGALIALHGSWDRSRLTGYKVIWMPWSGSMPATGVTPTDLVSGWESDATQTYWGRPVDTAVDAQGNIFITDDFSGTIYKLTHVGP